MQLCLTILRIVKTAPPRIAVNPASCSSQANGELTENTAVRYALALFLPAILLGSKGQQPFSDSTASDRLNRAQAYDNIHSHGTLFASDPQHPWNRLHRLLYSRTTHDGNVYDRESLEPLFLPESKFLTDGLSFQEAIALLDRFLKERADERVTEPLKRAIMQRDLWAVFSTTVSDARQVTRVDQERGLVAVTDRIDDPGDQALSEEQRRRRRELQKRLVQIMRRIALTREEINALPDNLAQAVNAGAFPEAFDPKVPSRAFLPTDLLAEHGSWVAVSNLTRANEDLLAAPEHVRFTKGRSVFTVFLRLPEGRPATEEFLRKMQDGNLRQFPEGTQTALLRSMLLIDRSGTIREAPLTESLQIRVYRDLDSGIPFEYTSRRSDLFAGRRGGLHAVGADETSYFDFQTRGKDVFEMPTLPAGESIMQTCSRCHSRADERGGIHTVNTVYARVDTKQRATGLVATTLKQEQSMTIDWVRKSFTWGLLQGLWEARTGE